MVRVEIEHRWSHHEGWTKGLDVVGEHGDGEGRGVAAEQDIRQPLISETEKRGVVRRNPEEG
jgi:hypothetical protein